MNVFEQFLDGREDRPNNRDRDRAVDAWQLSGKRPEERLLAFDCWVRQQLEGRLDWHWAGIDRDRRIEQCRVCLEQMVLNLWRRGWMLDGRRLAARIVELLDAVAKQQEAGKVRDFWSYFNASVQRYVGANAEEIQIEAARAGGHVRSVLDAITRAGGQSMPELLAQRRDEIERAKEESLRQRLARERARQAASDEAAKQGELFG